MNEFIGHLNFQNWEIPLSGASPLFNQTFILIRFKWRCPALCAHFAGKRQFFSPTLINRRQYLQEVFLALHVCSF